MAHYDNAQAAAEEAMENVKSPGEKEWPPFIPLDMPNLPRLSGDELSGWAGTFATAVAKATETPLELSTGLILATCASACARRYKVEVSEGYFEPTNLWIAVALPPGNRKSSVQALASAPLVSWEINKGAEMAPEIRRISSEIKTLEARVKGLRSKASTAKDAAEAIKLGEEAAAIEEAIPILPRPPQLWTSDATPERLGTILADNGERMAWLSSEGGIFELLGGRYSNGVANLDLALKAHSGDSERVDRGCRPPVYLRQPLLSIGLSPQPDVLRGLAAKPGLRGRGLLGRFLYLLPPSPLGFRNLESYPIPSDVIAKYKSGLTAILDVPSMLDADGEETLSVIRLSPEAYAEWFDFAKHIETTMRPNGEFEHARDWAGKAPGAAARLAGVMHVIECAYSSPVQRPVSLPCMKRTLELMAVISQHSLHALDLMGADIATSHARHVWNWIENGCREKFTVRDAHQALKGTFSRVKEVREALNVLDERGYLEITEEASFTAGRKPSPVVTVRPDIILGWTS